MGCLGDKTRGWLVTSKTGVCSIWPNGNRAGQVKGDWCRCLIWLQTDDSGGAGCPAGADFFCMTKNLNLGSLELSEIYLVHGQ
jgi:hypothetical protein